MYFCTVCKLDFDAVRVKDVTVKCPKCGLSKYTVRQVHPFTNIEKKDIVDKHLVKHTVGGLQ